MGYLFGSLWYLEKALPSHYKIIPFNFILCVYIIKKFYGYIGLSKALSKFLKINIYQAYVLSRQFFFLKILYHFSLLTSTVSMERLEFYGMLWGWNKIVFTCCWLFFVFLLVSIFGVFLWKYFWTFATFLMHRHLQCLNCPFGASLPISSTLNDLCKHVILSFAS